MTTLSNQIILSHHFTKDGGLAPKKSVTPPLLFGVPVTSKDTDQSYIFDFSSFHHLSVRFWNCSDVVIFFIFSNITTGTPRSTKLVYACLMLCSVDRCLSFYFRPLHCMSVFDLRLLITPVVSGAVVVVIARWLDLQLPGQSVPITTNVVSSNPVHREVYSIQHYVI